MRGVRDPKKDGKLKYASFRAIGANWLAVPVCRLFREARCRSIACHFAHVPPHVRTYNGKAGCCQKFLRGICGRTEATCKFYHPPHVILEKLMAHGRNVFLMGEEKKAFSKHTREHQVVPNPLSLPNFLPLNVSPASMINDPPLKPMHQVDISLLFPQETGLPIIGNQIIYPDVVYPPLGGIPHPFVLSTYTAIPGCFYPLAKVPVNPGMTYYQVFPASVVGNNIVHEGSVRANVMNWKYAITPTTIFYPVGAQMKAYVLHVLPGFKFGTDNLFDFLPDPRMPIAALPNPGSATNWTF